MNRPRYRLSRQSTPPPLLTWCPELTALTFGIQYGWFTLGAFTLVLGNILIILRLMVLQR